MKSILVENVEILTTLPQNNLFYTSSGKPSLTKYFKDILTLFVICENSAFIHECWFNGKNNLILI